MTCVSRSVCVRVCVCACDLSPTLRVIAAHCRRATGDYVCPCICVSVCFHVTVCLYVSMSVCVCVCVCVCDLSPILRAMAAHFQRATGDYIFLSHCVCVYRCQCVCVPVCLCVCGFVRPHCILRLLTANVLPVRMCP